MICASPVVFDIGNVECAKAHSLFLLRLVFFSMQVKAVRGYIPDKYGANCRMKVVWRGFHLGGRLHL